MLPRGPASHADGNGACIRGVRRCRRHALPAATPPQANVKRHPITGPALHASDSITTKGHVMKSLLTTLVFAAAALLAGCNTIEGAGRDIERGGEAVQDTARDVKREM